MIFPLLKTFSTFNIVINLFQVTSFIHIDLIIAGNPTKVEQNTEEEPQDSDSEAELYSDNDGDQSDPNPFPPFLDMKPRHIEFSDLFPEYPKTHEEGFATVIELTSEVAKRLAENKEFGSEMLMTLQYSRNNKSGHGWRLVRDVQFFSNSTDNQLKPMRQSIDIDDSDVSDEDDSRIPMFHAVRRCAGVKVCEYFKVTPHTEVNLDKLEWAQELAKQERSATYAGHARVLTLFETHKDETCQKPIVGGRSLCGGRTVIRSLAPKENGSVLHRLFIGCEKYQPREGKHMYTSLDTYDPLEVLKVWGRDRCYVHKDILQYYGMNWDEIEGALKYDSIANKYRGTTSKCSHKSYLSWCIHQFPRVKKWPMQLLSFGSRERKGHTKER